MDIEFYVENEDDEYTYYVAEYRAGVGFKLPKDEYEPSMIDRVKHDAERAVERKVVEDCLKTMTGRVSDLIIPGETSTVHVTPLVGSPVIIIHPKTEAKFLRDYGRI